MKRATSAFGVPLLLSALMILVTFTNTLVPPSSDLHDDVVEMAPPGDDPAISWTNVSGQTGLWNWGGNFFSWADFDDDGDQDLLVNGGRLLVNSGAPSYTFSDETSSRGVIGGHNTGTWGDIDNDGDLDLALGGTGADTILLNSGAPTYTFSNAAIATISNSAPTQGMSLRDWSGDGWLDLYVMNGENWNDGNPIYYRDFFYVNDQQGGFTNRSDLITSEAYYGRGISWADYDRDFDSDLYVGNYRIVPNRFYENRENPTTGTQELQERTSDTSDPSNVLEGEKRYYNTQGPYWGHTIGSAWGDMNNDGYPEIITANLVHLYYDSSDIRGLICDDSHFYTQDPVAGEQWHDFRPNSGISFKPRGGSGTYQGDELYSGVALGDVDNDGDLDMWFPQIYDLSYAKAELWINNGDFQFTQSSDAKLQVINTYGGTFVDYDNDGDLDLLTGGQDGVGQQNRIHLFRNDGPSGDDNHWLGVGVRGENGALEVGAAVEVWQDGQPIQYREVAGAEGPSASGAPLETHFGLGADGRAVDLLVTWPDKSLRWLRNVSVDQRVEVLHPDFAGAAVSPPALSLQGGGLAADEGETVNLDIDAQAGNEIWVDAGADGDYEIKIQNWTNALSPLPIVFENQGERTVRVLLFNSDGNGSATALKIDVNAVAPLARVEHPAYILPGEFVTFDAGSTEDATWDRTHMSYRWEWDDGFYRDFSPLITYTRSFDDPGSYNLTMTARDEQGLTGIFNEQVIVAAPIPNGTLSAPSDVSMDSPANFEFTLNPTHPNPQNVTYRFDWGDGSIRDWTTAPSAAHSWVEPGQFSVNISLRNEWGETADYLHQVNVTNVQPTIVWTATTAESEVGSPAIFQVQIGDTLSDQGDLDIAWWAGESEISGQNGLTLQHTFWQAGEHAVKARVTDRHGSSDEINTSIIVSELAGVTLDLLVIDGFLLDEVIHTTDESRLFWEVSDGDDWEIIDLSGVNADGSISSDSGVVIDLWSESRQERIYRVLTVAKMSLREHNLLKPCETYSPVIENLPNGAGAAYRWETSFGWVDATQLSATVSPNPVEVTLFYDNNTVVFEGRTSSFGQVGPTNNLSETEASYAGCAILFRVNGGDWVTGGEMLGQIENLSAGVYNVEYVAEDEGYYSRGGTFAHTVVESNGGGSDLDDQNEGEGGINFTLLAVGIVVVFLIGGLITMTVVLMRGKRKDSGGINIRESGNVAPQQPIQTQTVNLPVEDMQSIGSDSGQPAEERE